MRHRRAIPILQVILSPSWPLRPSSYILFRSLPLGTLSSRNFVSSPPLRSANFDTLNVVQRLEAEGFTPEQSKAIMELLKDVIDDSIRGLTTNMVTREEQDKV